MKKFITNNNNYTKYYFEDGVMKERPNPGTPRPLVRFYNKKNDLLRTAYFYLTYENEVLFKGIERCIERDQDGKITIWRSTDKQIYMNSPIINTIDRNTVCNLLWVLFLMGKDELLEDVIVNYKGNHIDECSLNFIDKLWLKHISCKRTILKKVPIHLLFFIFLFPISFFTNYDNLLTTQMQISASKNGILKRICTFLYKLSSDKQNFLSRVLLGEELEKRELKQIYPRNGFCFNFRFKDYFTRSNNFRIQSYNESEFNELDRYLIEQVQKKLRDIKYRFNI